MDSLPQLGFPTLTVGQKKFNSRPVAPTRLDVMRFKDDRTDVPIAVTSNQPLSRNLTKPPSLPTAAEQIARVGRIDRRCERYEKIEVIWCFQSRAFSRHCRCNFGPWRCPPKHEAGERDPALSARTSDDQTLAAVAGAAGCWLTLPVSGRRSSSDESLKSQRLVPHAAAAPTTLSSWP
jgi:hypothetical protein